MTEHADAGPAGAIPRPDAAEIRALLRREVTLPSRLGYTALLVAGLLMACVTAALLVTEAGLPDRTRIAFAVLTSIGLAWSVFAGWVLARRRVLFAGHRVAGAVMAMVFTGAFTIGAVLVGRIRIMGEGWIAAALVGTTLFVAAALLLVRARARHAALVRRRTELERAIRRTAGEA
jgi:hypothetical protein